MWTRLSLAFPLLLATALAAQAPVPKEPAKCTVEGQVVQDPGSRPIRKATLELAPVDQEDGTSYTAVSDPEGHFKIENIEPGRYTLSVEHNGFSSPPRHRQGHSLALDSGQEIKDIVFRLQPSAVITGKIVDNDGDPVAHVSVVAQSRTGSRYRGFGRSSNTNDLGEYRIGNLEPGQYLIKATSVWGSFQASETGNGHSARPPVPYATYYPGTTDKTQAVPVELHPGDELPANFGLAYGPAFRIRGTVSGVPALKNTFSP